MCDSYAGHGLGIKLKECVGRYAICMSKCRSNVANGTGVMSGVSWIPDGFSLISLIHRK